MALQVRGKFAGFVRFGRYEDDSPAIIIHERESGDGPPLVKATVRLVNVKPRSPDALWIKTWSENEGLLQDLEDAGVVRATGEIYAINSHAMAFAARLTEAARAEMTRQLAPH